MKSRLIFLAFILFSFSQIARADGVLISWSPQDVPGLTEQAFNAAKQFNVEEILKKNLGAKSWADAFLLMVAARQHKDDKGFLMELASQIANNAKVDLKGTNRLIIWERITTGDIQFEGKGYQVNDDLFTVAGRANWLLRNLADRNFGYVRPNSSNTELNKLQQLWSLFLTGENTGFVYSYEDPYYTSVEGLEEIRSFEALEALIVSLAPTTAKENLTKDCLTRLYHLDKLPNDPDSPAALCSPDKYTLGYLRMLTGIIEKHEAAWWKKWWDTNRDQLKWNKEKGSFEVGKQKLS